MWSWYLSSEVQWCRTLCLESQSSDITGTPEWITLYHMFMQADIQRSKESLQVQLIIQGIISNVVAFLTEGAHTLEVLHRVHPSALLMMDTCRKLWRVST